MASLPDLDRAEGLFREAHAETLRSNPRPAPVVVPAPIDLDVLAQAIVEGRAHVERAAP